MVVAKKLAVECHGQAKEGFAMTHVRTHGHGMPRG